MFWCRNSLLLFFLTIFLLSCETQKEMRRKQVVGEKTNTMVIEAEEDLRGYYKKYPGYFLGFGIGVAKSKHKAIEMSNLEAIADLIQTIDVAIRAVTEMISKDGKIHQSELHSLVIAYSNKRIRNPEYKILRLWRDKHGFYHSQSIALKKRREYFDDYSSILTENRRMKMKEMFDVFDAYYDKYIIKE